MATASICSQFDITIIGAADLNTAKSFTLTRALTFVSCEALNIAAAAGTLTITNTTTGNVITATTAAPPLAGAGVVQAQAVTGPTAPVTLLVANASAASGAVISVVTSAATITKVLLGCIGNPAQSISIA